MIFLSNEHPTKRVEIEKLGRRMNLVARNEGLARQRLDFIFIDNKRISKLSGMFRGIFHSTDVLSFNYGNGVKGSPYGEIIVSLDVAYAQAKKRKMLPIDEITLYCVHGVIHLTGQCDEDVASWKKMREREFSNMMSVL